MWDSRDASWESGYERLLRFAQREGHCRVPSNYRDESGFRLDTWVAVQRRSRTRHELSRQRVRRLETVPGWLWEPKEMAWEDGYARLQAFVEREGHSRVPQPSRDDDGYALGTWVAAQRAFRRRGQLSDDRAQRLEAVSGWVWHVRDAKWEAAYARLHRFVEREGHSRVPDAYRDDDGYELGGWVRRQRDSRRRGVLSKDRARRLDALPGWVWEKKYEGAWDDGYARLQAFVHREGHSRVPGSYREDDGYALGVWVATQRNARKKGRLADVRARRLEALPRWAWDPYEADWREGLAALEEFVEREGHTHVPVAWRENGYRLGQWLRVQRREHGRGTLRPERRAAPRSPTRLDLGGTQGRRTCQVNSDQKRHGAGIQHARSQACDGTATNLSCGDAVPLGRTAVGKARVEPGLSTDAPFSSKDQEAASQPATLNLSLAGVGSRLPAASTARTWNLCLPPSRCLTLFGDGDLDIHDSHVARQAWRA